MPSRARKARLSPGSLSIFFGVALSGLLTYVLLLGRHPTNWEHQARELWDNGDYIGAIEAANNCLETEPGNYDVLFLRAQAYNLMELRQRALNDIEEAIQKNPNSIRFLSFKAALLATLGRHEDGIAVLDEVLERFGNNPGNLLQAASARVRQFTFLDNKLRGILDQRHSDRVRIFDWVDAHYSASSAGSRERKLLVDGLPGSDLQQEMAELLTQTWNLLREADQLLSDTRTFQLRAPLAYLIRAELDMRLGRFLRSKENLQTLLKRDDLQTGVVRRALTLLAELYNRSGTYSGEVRCRRQMLEFFGGISEAPIPPLADMFEAEFHAAQVEPGRRPVFSAMVDEHLDEHGSQDMRTKAYRGIAALEWEDDPKQAARLLSDVYDTMRLQRHKDPSVSEPRRARRFLIALLRAYKAIGRHGSALSVTNSLMALAPDDPELRRLRAEVLLQQGRSTQAAEELLEAMRTSTRDAALFDAWLEANAQVEDPSGRTPIDRARDLAERLSTARQELQIELDRSEEESLGNRSETIAQKNNDILSLTMLAAAEPILAWHLSEAFARDGDTIAARNFIFEASSHEPDVLAFRFRLAGYRLALGSYRAAAEEFEAILERDPMDSESALLAVKAWELEGELERAREMRRRLILADPSGAGLPLLVRSALEARDFATAGKILTPLASQPGPVVPFLAGLVKIDQGDFESATTLLLNASEQDPDSTEILLNLVLCQGLLGKRKPFDELVERLARLPGLPPLPEVEWVLEYLEAKQRFAFAASLAGRIGGRYGDEAAYNLQARAAVYGIRAGDPDQLRTLRDRESHGQDLPNTVIQAAFGLTLREEGPHRAASYLRSVREFSDESEWAALPTAAAFALTPYRIELNQFLDRFHRSHRDQPVPFDKAVLWWLTYSRAAPKPPNPPELESGAEAEVAFLKEAGRGEQGRTLEELYLYMLLYQFAGKGFETDALEYAAQIMALDRRGASAARLIAERMRDMKGPGEAARSLTRAYQANPNDYQTFKMLGELLAAKDKQGSSLMSLAESGLKSFPDRILPPLLAGTAAMTLGDAERAHEFALVVLDRDPTNIEALRLAAKVSIPTGDRDMAERIAISVATNGIEDALLRSFLVRTFGDEQKDRTNAIHLFMALLNNDPSYYEAALALSRQLISEGREKELPAVIKRVTTAVPSDPNAAGRAGILAQLIQILHSRKYTRAATSLAEVALIAAPANAALRRQSVLLKTESAAAADALGDLTVLSLLEPGDPELILQYGELLITERSDQAGTLFGRIQTLRTEIPDDPRLHSLVGKLLFLSDQMPAAAAEFRKAMLLAADEPEYRYWYGVVEYLQGNAKTARAALGSLPPRFKFRGRAKELLSQL